MRVKQEPPDFSEKDTIVIKQEIAFDVLTEVTTEKLGEFKNDQPDHFLTVNLKQEPHSKATGDFFLNSETEHPEVKGSDLFITSYDLNLIKQEVIQTECIVPKAKILNYCDLPSLKSDVEYLEEPSTSNHSQYILESSKPDAVKEKVRRNFCPICQKNYSSFRRGSTHLDGHFWKHWRACEFCGHFYTDKFEYFLHYFNHFVNINNKRLLNFKTSRPLVLKNYRLDKSCKNNIQKSSLNKKQFKIKTNLNNQKKNYIVEKKFRCKICLKPFTHRGSLHNHEKIHSDEKPFECEMCLKKFIRKSSLTRHLRSHTGEKPYKCEICLKKFKQKTNLNQHFLIIHTGEKPFKCEICSKQFSQKTNLTQHLKFHTNEKSFKCEICLELFTFSQSLKKHIKLHTDQSPFQCKMCLKQFTLKSGLIKHEYIHLGIKPFKCEICSRQFTQKSHLNKHILNIHTYQKPLNCEICLKLFTRKCDLSRHIKMHTKKKQ